jgi:23S rRNA pseudouridine2605 synthase
VRLARFLAHSGVASRRGAEDIIRAGRVTVGAEIVTDPARDVDEHSRVLVDGRPVAPEPREVWLVNKPLDVTSTAREPGRRTAVVELVDSDARLYPVGRLDADTTGLILLTNDGDLANRLMHPRHETWRTYRVTLGRAPSDAQQRRLRAGVELDDGPTLPARVKRVGPRVLEISIREGRNRQVRRMVEAVGNRVAALERIAFGPLRLGRMKPGQARRLSSDEVRGLWKDAQR